MLTAVSQQQQQSTLSTMAAGMTKTHSSSDESVTPGEDHSSSGSSTVAIDNKIEQAMDLVKSHLMFAVREEVEVLKIRITELMERISCLESENSILRSSASQDTLNQLTQLEASYSSPVESSNSSSSTTGTTSAQNGTSAP